MLQSEPFDYKQVLGTRLDASDYSQATHKIMGWAHNGQSRYVCAGTVQVVMEAYDSAMFQRIVNSADMVTPDSMSLAFTLRCFGAKSAHRVQVPLLMLQVCEAAAKDGVSIALYGGSNESVRAFSESLLLRFPTLDIVFSYAPPCHDLAPFDDEEIVQKINDSGARIMLVGLSCPKQERWMVEHKGRIGVVMLGVGEDAFSMGKNHHLHALNGLQHFGLQGVRYFDHHRFSRWLRYTKHNFRFFGLVILQLFHLRDFTSGKLHRSPSRTLRR